ncbi:MAG: uroporphyrinogen-III synthase [Bacteroidetes bacterium]|nr:uroporphyrinogen-III synthase [Bacteroidota bacterium]
MKPVFFTRPLSDFDLRLCATLEIDPIIHPLIGIEPASIDHILSNNPTFWADLDRATAVVFTSQHAVDALLGELPSFREEPSARDQGNPAEKILQILQKKPVYTVGEITADTLDEYGIMARFPEDYNGTVLAEMMLNDGVHTSVMHFCGNIRRPEFRDEMLQAHVEVIQVEVYRKTEHQLDKALAQHVLDSVKAVAFYSPSAVHSFWNQGMNQHYSGPYFVIGHTTLAALQDYKEDGNLPRIPTSELLIREIAKHI